MKESRGRPKKIIDAETVEKLAALNCSSEEVADWFGVDKRTIERRFMSQLKKGRSNGKISLKRKMFEMAIGGNCTMAIWLSKQMLGYTDKVENKSELKPFIIERSDGSQIILGAKESENKNG